MAVPEEKDPDFLALLDRIRRERGFDGTQYKTSFLKRRLAVRLRARKVDCYRQYMRLLDEDPDEYVPLMSALTINLTYFFRDSSAFVALRDLVLAPMLEAKREQKRFTVRVWSAGCATGEEAYSLSILFHELLGSKLPRWDITVLATDYDAEVLDRARRGVYGDLSFRDVDEEYLARYFIHGDGYQVKPEIKALVTFRQHDLVSDPMPKRLDLILCRNVLIYFSRGQHERLFHQFHQALREGGYLALGKTEILLPSVSHLFRPVNLREHIYIKASERDNGFVRVSRSVSRREGSDS